MGFFTYGLKNEFETAVVNEPSVFAELLKFYCTKKFQNKQRNQTDLLCHFNGAFYLPFKIVSQAYFIVVLIQSTLVISTTVISNNRFSRRENLVLVLTQKSKIRLQNIVEKRRNCSWGAISPFSKIFFNIYF